MKPNTQQIELAASAIANARGMRRGVPAVTNVMDLLSEKLKAEVRDDARAALEVIFNDPSTITAAIGETAEQITNDLFTEGGGRTARPLVMEIDGSAKFPGSGWCRQAVVDRVTAVLKQRFLLS